MTTAIHPGWAYKENQLLSPEYGRYVGQASPQLRLEAIIDVYAKDRPAARLYFSIKTAVPAAGTGRPYVPAFYVSTSESLQVADVGALLAGAPADAAAAYPQLLTMLLRRQVTSARVRYRSGP